MPRRMRQAAAARTVRGARRRLPPPLPEAGAAAGEGEAVLAVGRPGVPGPLVQVREAAREARAAGRAGSGPGAPPRAPGRAGGRGATV